MSLLLPGSLAQGRYHYPWGHVARLPGITKGNQTEAALIRSLGCRGSPSCVPKIANCPSSAFQGGALRVLELSSLQGQLWTHLQVMPGLGGHCCPATSHSYRLPFSLFFKKTEIIFISQEAHHLYKKLPRLLTPTHRDSGGPFNRLPATCNLLKTTVSGRLSHLASLKRTSFPFGKQLRLQIRTPEENGVGSLFGVKDDQLGSRPSTESQFELLPDSIFPFVCLFILGYWGRRF